MKGKVWDGSQGSMANFILQYSCREISICIDEGWLYVIILHGVLSTLDMHEVTKGKLG